LTDLSLKQGATFLYDTKVKRVNQGSIETELGHIYEADNIAICTNGEGYYEHFNLTPVKVRSA